jgi:taurine dioxygenase
MNCIVPQAEQIGFEIVDVDLAASSASLIESIKQLIYIHKLVILRNQRITPDHHPNYPEIFVSANIPIDGHYL